MAVKDVFFSIYRVPSLVLVLLYFWLYSSKLVTNTAVDPYVVIKYKTKGFFIRAPKR